jgi:hypothetical protein
VIVPVEVRGEPALHLGNVVEAVHVEQLLVQVGVENLDLPVPLLVLRHHLVDSHLRQQVREARDAAP